MNGNDTSRRSLELRRFTERGVLSDVRSGGPRVGGPKAREIDRYAEIRHCYTSEAATPMRTNIEIDDTLIRRAMRSSGARTKWAVVEEGLIRSRSFLTCQ